MERVHPYKVRLVAAAAGIVAISHFCGIDPRMPTGREVADAARAAAAANAAQGTPTAGLDPSALGLDGCGWSAEQRRNAKIITQVGVERGLPRRAHQIALATAIQESGLRNLNHGDRDSLGLFQQRPSQGWGTPSQVRDERYAAAKFYERLSQVKRWEAMPLTVAAQAVQLSGFPGAYAQWEPAADRLLVEIAENTIC